MAVGSIDEEVVSGLVDEPVVDKFKDQIGSVIDLAKAKAERHGAWVATPAGVAAISAAVRCMECSIGIVERTSNTTAFIVGYCAISECDIAQRERNTSVGCSLCSDNRTKEENAHQTGNNGPADGAKSPSHETTSQDSSDAAALPIPGESHSEPSSQASPS